MAEVEEEDVLQDLMELELQDREVQVEILEPMAQAALELVEMVEQTQVVEEEVVVVKVDLV
jgi:hypothetical protein